MKTKKLGRCEFESKGFKVMPIYDNEKPTGKYGIIAGKKLVSDVMSLKDAIEKLKSEDFVPIQKKKRK